MTELPKTSFDRLDFVDAIRGLAALYVVTFHLVFIPNPSLELPFWVTSFIHHGDTGVTLFFIASAFTLAYSMKQRELEQDVTLRFYIRRIFRIFPLFYFWLILYLLRDFHINNVSYSFQDIFLNATFLFNFFPGKSEGIVWASWTLGIEVVFYVMFPLIYKYVNNFWKSVGFLLLSIMIAGIWVQNLTHYFPSTESTYKVLSFLYRMPSFIFGLVVFHIYQKMREMEFNSFSVGFALICASALGYHSMISGGMANLLVDELYWESAICSVFLLGLAILPLKILVNKVTLFLGKISYSFYLDHPQVIFYMIPIFRYYYSLSLPTTLQYTLSLISIVIVLTMLAFITYSLIEKPGMKLGSWIIKNKDNLVAREAFKSKTADAQK